MRGFYKWCRRLQCLGRQHAGRYRHQRLHPGQRLQPLLAADGFEVFPYTTEDLVVGERLVEAGCRVLMPWGAPIGSGRGLNNLYGLRAMRAHFPDIPLVVDAGIGLPSQAAAAMELGYDAVLLNTAVARAGDPALMAAAFGQAIEAGRQAYLAEPMPMRDMAVPSTPVLGLAFRG